MQNILRKSISLLTVVLMVSAIFAPTFAYAANEVQDANTTEENVKFNATVNDGYSTSCKLAEGGNLNLDITVSNSGYLKNAKVTLSENNYKLGTTDNKVVKSINGNVIELNEINVGDEAKVSIPFTFDKQDQVSLDSFNKDSKVTFTATYVNENGKEKKITKELIETVAWTAEPSENLAQALTRYIKYDTKTIVSFDVKEGIKDNLVPVKSKKIDLVVPKINNKFPEQILISDPSYKNTYTEKDGKGIVEIIKETQVVDNKIQWNSEDTFGITYVYDSQEDVKTINQTATSEATTINDVIAEAEAEEKEFNVEATVGNLVDLKIDGTQELTKGQLLANLNKETKANTEFNTTYNIGVGFADLTDKIVLSENAEQILNANGTKVSDADIITTKVSVDANDIKRVLGDEGTITVKNSSNGVIGTLNTTTTELKVSNSNIKFETSKAVKQGNIKLNLTKNLIDDGESTKEQINAFDTLKSSVTIKNVKDDKEIQNNIVENSIKLINPTSKANIELNRNNLSTVVENKDVVINVTLVTKDINDSLYTNPSIKVTLPSEVTGINVTKANVIYDDTMSAGNVIVNGNTIQIDLQGTQTEYSKTTSNGAIIRLVTDLKLNDLAPSNVEKITAEVLNNATGETVVTDADVNIVAPTGFVTTNTLKIDNNEKTAVESDAEKIKVPAKSAYAKEGIVSGKIINNLGKNADKVVILGRIPFKGNNGTTLDTSLEDKVNTTLSNAQIFYSTKGDEKIDGNGWTSEIAEGTKSFKIVSESGINDKDSAEFSYKINIPSDLDYDGVANISYGVYYANGATEGNAYDLVESKTVGFETGKKPNVDLTVEAYDRNTGNKIDNQANVSEGQNIILKFKAKNTGSEKLDNVNFKAEISGDLGIDYIVDAGEKIDEVNVENLNAHNIVIKQPTNLSEMEKPDFNFDDLLIYKNIIKNISINAGDTYELDLGVRVDARLTEEDKKSDDQIIEEAQLTVSSSNLENEVHISNYYNLVEGTIELNNLTKIANDLKVSDKFDIKFNVVNPNSIEKKNVEVNLSVPDGIKLVDDTNGMKQNGNTITIDKFDLQKNETKNITVPVYVEKVNNSTNGATVNAKYNDVNKTLTINLGSQITDENGGVVTATQTTNVTDSEITDREKIEYYTTIINNTKSSKTIYFEDLLSSDLVPNDCTIIINGKEETTLKGRILAKSFELPSNGTAKIIIRAEINSFENGKTKEITNKPSIIVNGLTNLDVNAITIKVKGTGDKNSSENGDIEAIKNKITGTIWFDANNNGIKDEGEEKIANIKVKLYDVDSSQYVKDNNGKDIEKTTDKNGNYSFENLNNGDYIVVAEYDSNKYDVGNYKVSGATEAENSDFITSIIDGNTVAVTDSIKVNNSNTYNIDLGLTSKNVFDLKLDKLVSKVTIYNPNASTKNKVYEFNKNVAKVELSSKNVESNTAIVEYKIQVSNVGKVGGYAKSVVDYLPEGMSFNADLNKDWYIKDGNAYNTSLANTIINPGETKEITLVLTKKVNGQNIGLFRNTAEIASEYNEQGFDDVNSVAGNKADGENDMSSADTFILISTGKEILSITGITVGILSIITLGVILVKKHVINKIV